MNRIVMAGLVIAALTAGCAASSKGNPELDKAQAEYEQLSNDPQVQTNAPALLLDAGQSLQAAAAATKQEVRDHHLYIANRQMEIARTLTQRHLVEQKTRTLAQQRDQLLAASRERQLSQAESRAKQLESELAALETKRTGRGTVITLGGVFFDTATTTLKPAAYDTIDRLSAYLKAHPDQTMVVEGHTDSLGPESFNLNLSRERAESVKQAIAAQGIDPGRIVTRGYGESRPVASNATAGGRQLNRRVEIVLPPNT